MGKLLMLKEWLTLDEAAARLSVSAGEVVTQSDILRLAIDNHLQLSVFIDDNLTVRSMDFEVEEIDGMKCLMLGKGALEPCRINGLWDLAAYGEGVGELERLYREQKGFSPTSRLELSNMGLYLHDKEKTEVYEVLRIQMKFKFVEKSAEHGTQTIGSDAATSESRLTVDADKSLIGDINTLLREGLGLHDPVIDEKLCSFYREHHFPKHCLIVLRREEMLAFESRHFGGSIKAELSPTERSSSHQIIAALASMANIDLSAPYKAVGIIKREAELKGLELPSSDETIVKFLTGPTRRKR